MSLWEFANPNRFIILCERFLPFCVVLTILLLNIGLFWGFFFTPDDYRQGSTVKIIYIHVPSAFLGINIYFMMFIASIVWLVKRHHVSALAAKAAAPIGLSMTVIAMITGALWGQPMWGTYWAWDPRLTSFAILLLFYISYTGLWFTIEDNDKAADLAAILCLIGSVFAILSRYAVLFWNQGLHQGASLSLDKEENISDVFFQPLIVTMGGFFMLFITLLLIRTRTEIRARRINNLLRMRK